VADPSTPTPGYQRLFAELKRRHVFRVMAVYGAVGFLLLQVLDLLVPVLLLPEWTYRLVGTLLLLGFPVAMVLAWAFESTPTGVRRTGPAATGELEAIAAQPAAKRWPSGLLAAAATGLFVGAVWVGLRAGGTAPVVGAPGDDVAAGPAGRVAAEAAAKGDAPDDAVLRVAYADLSADDRPSIAVLPFVNMSAEAEQEYFADGMTEELLNALAKIRALRVAGRTSSFAYKGEDRDLREIGDELGVRYLVEGSVRKQGDRLRITAQLVDAADAFHVWSDQYDRTLDDVFAIQTEIAESIAEALEVSLGLAAADGLVTPTGDLDAYDLYLAAQARFRERETGVAESIRLFEAAVARDSGWAPAWAGLAQARALYPYYADAEVGFSRDAEFWERSLEAAERAARRALALEPENAAAEVALANIFRDRREWRAAERHYLRALAIDPDDVEAHQQYAEYLAASGRLAEALRSAQRAVALDPTSSIRHYVLGYVESDNGRHADALASYERAVAIAPGLIRAQAGVIEELSVLGAHDRAMARIGSDLMPAVRAQSERTEPELREGEAIWRSLVAALRDRDGAALEACCSETYPAAFARIGDIERALDQLARVVDEDPGYGTTFLTTLWAEEWDGVRDDPRFVSALRFLSLEGVEPDRAPPVDG
jgi:TolB-like protein